MAYLTATGNGNASGSHYQSSNAPTISASQAVVESFSTTYTATFTADATLPDSLGCWIYIAKKRFASDTITLTLQENGIDTSS